MQSLGKIEDGIFKPTEIGEICKKYWQEIPMHYQYTKLHNFCIMPNHIHGIVEITNASRRDVACNVSKTEQLQSLSRDVACNVSTNKNYSTISPKSDSIPSIIRSYKYSVGQYAKKNNIVFQFQSRYHDHIIKSEKEFHATIKYIDDNVKNWEQDSENIKVSMNAHYPVLAGGSRIRGEKNKKR